MFKCFRVAKCQLGENFAVKSNFGLFQLVHKLAIGKIVLGKRPVNSGYPEAAQIAFFQLPTMKSILTGMKAGFFGHLKKPRFGAAVALGQL